jgi:hypothetical protein
MGRMAKDSGFDSWQEQDILFTASETQPIFYPMGYEADHSLPSSVKVTNTWIYTSTPEYICMAWCLVN